MLAACLWALPDDQRVLDYAGCGKGRRVRVAVDHGLGSSNLRFDDPRAFRPRISPILIVSDYYLVASDLSLLQSPRS